MAQLGLGKQFEHGGGQQVSRRVMEDLERLGVFLGEQAQARILLDGPGEIDDGEGIVGGGIAVDGHRRKLGGQGGVGQARRNGLRDVEGGGALGNLLDAAVGELNFNLSHIG